MEDLLDLRQLKDGVFNLTSNLFDPNEIFQVLVDTFTPQAQAKKIAIEVQKTPDVLLPEEMYP